MKLADKNNKLTNKESIKSTVYQLHIFEYKTTNVILFRAHFRRKPKTPLSNMSTLPKSSHLTYEQILNHYLDADTIPSG